MARKKTKARKAKRKVIKKAAKRAARKSKKIVKRARRKAAKSARPAKKTKKAAKRTAPRRTKDVFGEGNYTASRRFREDQEDFVRSNKERIAQLGEAAEAALEGPEGVELARAEDEARSHARG